MSLLPQEIIAVKRDGGRLSDAHISAFVTGLADGSWQDAQAAALAMAILLNGLEDDERTALTLAMAHSGDRITWEDLSLNGPVLDKHSTGGVGDKVSLIIAPVVAACGGYMPKMSGRGLGHTGGTVDKMEAIPGYQTAPDAALFRRTVQDTGFAIIGQTGRLAPADKRLYGIRDVTATVQSIDLISASIISKKLAVSPDVLVLDVKFGSGAFMGAAEDARALAKAMQAIGNGAGVKTGALLTDMDEVLGHSVGNANEVREAIRFLTGAAQDTRLRDVCNALSGHLLSLAGLGDDETAARALDSGAAAERFGQMVHALGGPADLMEQPDKHLQIAPVAHIIRAGAAGYVAAMDSQSIGFGLVELGGGRRATDDQLDHSAGLELLAPRGAKVAAGDPLLEVRSQRPADPATLKRLEAAFTIRDEAPAVTPAVLERLS